MLGSIRILDQPKLLQVVSEGGSGYFFEKEAEKICLVRNIEHNHTVVLEEYLETKLSEEK